MNSKASKFHIALIIIACLLAVRPPCGTPSAISEIMLAENRDNLSGSLKKIARVSKEINKLKADISEMESARSGKENTFQQLVQQLSRLEKLENELGVITIDESKLEKADIFDDQDKLNALRAELRQSGVKSHEMEAVINYFHERRGFIKKKKILTKIISSINALKADINKKENLRENLRSNRQKAKISSKIQKLNARLKKLEYDFAIITSGIDVGSFYQRKGKKLNWENELKEIFSPIIMEFKELTERPRKMEKLKADLMYYESRVPKMEKAIQNIKKFQRDVKNEYIKKELQEAEIFWVEQKNEFISGRDTVHHQLMEKRRERLSAAEIFNNFFQTFFKRRGRNIFLSITAFVCVYFTFLFIQRLLYKITPLYRSPRRRFLKNLTDVLFYFFSFLSAAAAMLFVLYITGDWVVLAITVIILLGIVWTARNTLPRLAEHIKLLLGVGAVREDEVIIYKNILWKVESIGLYSHFKNPALTGGTLRLPLRRLINMRSRPYDAKEPWFPCREGDWTLINNKDWRQVLLQTPEVVKLAWHGMEEIRTTADFAGQNIINLSAGPFWAGISFYISYKHRFTIIEEISEKLAEFVLEDLKDKNYAEYIINPWVDFSEMTNSSLGLLVWIRMRKEAASEYPFIQIDLRQSALKAANKFGWEVLRFNRISLHSTEKPDSLSSKNNPPFF